jgi:hypothetical protein
MYSVIIFIVIFNKTSDFLKQRETNLLVETNIVISNLI